MSEDQSQLNRREFVVALGVAACACAMGSSQILAADATTQPAGLIDVGTLADYPADGASAKFSAKHKLLIIRDNKHLIATTTLCPHKGCTVKPSGTDKLVCPCHKSDFGLDGIPTKGPAKKPLVRYGIALDDADHVQVDMSKKFEQADWADAGSFVAIP